MEWSGTCPSYSVSCQVSPLWWARWNTQDDGHGWGHSMTLRFSVSRFLYSYERYFRLADSMTTKKEILVEQILATNSSVTIITSRRLCHMTLSRKWHNLPPKTLMFHEVPKVNLQLTLNPVNIPENVNWNELCMEFCRLSLMGGANKAKRMGSLGHLKLGEN